ncbi:MAG: hydroxyacid dehydrogenase [Synergistaceae bacterium]|nr:hydroxyacid dehydrogenase [Synergistaceae bacterium]
MYKILLTEKIHNVGIEYLKLKADVIVANDTKIDTLLAAIKGVDAIIIRSTKMYNEVIDASDKLRVIGRHGIGLDNIDVEYATRKKIAVINSPRANIISVAEHVIAQMMALSKKLFIAAKAMREGKTSIEGKSLPGLCQSLGLGGVELTNKTLGVAGFGKIGSLTAQKCMKAFDMQVLVYDPPVYNKFELPEGARWVETLDELLMKSDYITLNVPLLPSTRNLIGETQLKMMKSSAFLINSARGGIVDESALYRALKENWIAGAALDVFEQEPPRKDLPLFELDNIVITPHAAAMTEESLQRMAMEVSEGVLKMLDGEIPYNLVNKTVASCE